MTRIDSGSTALWWLALAALAGGCGRWSYEAVAADASEYYSAASAYYSVQATPELGPECQNIRSDADGLVYITGMFRNLEMGSTVLATAGAPDAYVAAFGSELAPKWALGFGGGDYDVGVRLLPRGQGVLAQLTVDGNVNDNGIDSPSLGINDYLLVSLDQEGIVSNFARLGSPEVDGFGRGLVMTSSGAIAVAGGCGDGFSFGGPALPGNGTLNPCLALLDSNLQERGARVWLGTESGAVRGLAHAPDDELVLGVSNAGVLDYQGNDFASAGERDAVVVRRAADGTPKWFGTVVGAGDELIQEVVSDGTRSYLVLTSTSEMVTINGSAVRLTGTDSLLVAFDHENGALLWYLLLSGPGDEWIEDVALLPDGRVGIVGSHQAGAMLGDLPLESPGDGEDGVVAVIDGQEGTVAWAGSYGSIGDDRLMSLWPDGADDLLLCGVLGGEVDFGNGPRGIPSTRSVALVRLTRGM